MGWLVLTMVWAYGGKKCLFLFAVLLLIPSQTVVFAQSEPNTNHNFTRIEGDDIKNNPIAQQILQKIEESKKILAELQSGKPQLTEHQKFIEEQRKIAQQQLQEELDRMNKRYADYTPQAAFSKYVSQFPEAYHEFLWEHFNYLYSKVEVAREYRDQILANGGSYQDAQQVFIDYAKITKAERNQFTEDMIKKYELYNKVSNIDDFNDLPEDTKAAFVNHMKNIGLGDYALRPMYDPDPTSDTTSVSDTQSSAEATSETFSIDNIEETSTTQIIDLTLEDGSIETTQPQQKSLTMINFDGNSFETIQMASMNIISEFTLSTWVKPDYDTGSSEFTILSKENAFKLTIDNALSDNTASFSIFDGIKWTSIKSYSSIPEDWTHISATFDGQLIRLYINGNLEARAEIEGIPTLNSRGYVELKPIEGIESESPIFYGAQQITKNDGAITKGFFSGQIDEVLIDNKKLDSSVIKELCNQSTYFSL